MIFLKKAVKCGHQTHRTGKVSAFGQSIKTKMPINEDGTVDYCLDCLAKMVIRCGWCGEPIFIGNPITLYTPPEDFEIPYYAVIYNEDPLQIVGCLGWDCAQSGADRAGFWVPGEDGKGQVERVRTPFEILLGEKAPSMVIIQDTGDVVEARGLN